jgi:hypothetical protein
MLPPGRWALTPPFHPYRRSRHSRCPEGFPSSYHRVRFAGGIFSVALSVNRSTGFSLCSSTSARAREGTTLVVPQELPTTRGFSPRKSFLRNSHRRKPQTQVCATAPLALPGALPFTSSLVEGTSPSPILKANPPPSRSGVRTFLPPRRAGDHPAHPPLKLYREFHGVRRLAAAFAVTAMH